VGHEKHTKVLTALVPNQVTADIITIIATIFWDKELVLDLK
jgi:hypothetical protein